MNDKQQTTATQVRLRAYPQGRRRRRHVEYYE